MNWFVSTPTGGIHCSAFLSCQNAKLMSAGSLVACAGEQSCENSVIKTNEVHCRSVKACAFTTMYIENVTDCMGSYSCYGAIIQYSAGKLDCHSHDSCANTIIKNVTQIYGEGHRSLMNATILPSQDLYLQFFGTKKLKKKKKRSQSL